MKSFKGGVMFRFKVMFLIIFSVGINLAGGLSAFANTEDLSDELSQEEKHKIELLNADFLAGEEMLKKIDGMLSESQVQILQEKILDRYHRILRIGQAYSERELTLFEYEQLNRALESLSRIILDSEMYEKQKLIYKEMINNLIISNIHKASEYHFEDLHLALIRLLIPVPNYTNPEDLFKDESFNAEKLAKEIVDRSDHIATEKLNQAIALADDELKHISLESKNIEQIILLQKKYINPHLGMRRHGIVFLFSRFNNTDLPEKDRLASAMIFLGINDYPVSKNDLNGIKNFVTEKTGLTYSFNNEECTPCKLHRILNAKLEKRQDYLTKIQEGLEGITKELERIVEKVEKREKSNESPQEPSLEEDDDNNQSEERYFLPAPFPGDGERFVLDSSLRRFQSAIKWELPRSLSKYELREILLFYKKLLNFNFKTQRSISLPSFPEKEPADGWHYQIRSLSRKECQFRAVRSLESIISDKKFQKRRPDIVYDMIIEDILKDRK